MTFHDYVAEMPAMLYDDLKLVRERVAEIEAKELERKQPKGYRRR